MHQPQVLQSALQCWQLVSDSCPVPGDRDSQPTVDFGQTMALSDFVAKLENIAAETESPALGWKVGEAVPLPHFGDIWQAVDSSRTLGSALRKMCEYFALLQDLTEMRLVDEGEYVALSYRILDPTIWPRHQDAIYTLAIKTRILIAAEGFSLDEAEIYLESSDEALALQLERVSGIVCRPGAETNMIRFPVACLGLKMNPAHAVDARKVSDLARRLKDKRRAKLVEERVRSTIYSRLGRDAVNQACVAEELGLSDRTLRRKLAASNTNFQTIVDDCRIRQAVLEIARCKTVSIAEIALRLGYSEHSTFSRAFSRCMGMPPQAFLRGVARQERRGLAAIDRA